MATPMLQVLPTGASELAGQLRGPSWGSSRGAAGGWAVRPAAAPGLQQRLARLGLNGGVGGAGGAFSAEDMDDLDLVSEACGDDFGEVGVMGLLRAGGGG